MAEAAPHYGTLRFDIPDQSSTSEERGLFAPPGAKEVVYEKLPLHNFHTSPDVVKGGAGLDVQGFTWIQHRSVLQNSDQWLEGQNIEATYLAECEDLICRATGAKRAIANNAFFRRRPQDDMSDPKHVHLRDTPLDKAIGQLPRDANYVFGRDAAESSLPPARMAHSDYSVTGLRSSVRYCRKDICEKASEALEAEDEKSALIPRYAAYSVWRPIKPVKKDPIALCDWRTIDKQNESTTIEYRATSGVTENGEYIIQGLIGLPPKHPIKQKWYWVPEQKPDEVAIIKFADTAGDTDQDVAQGCLHLSPVVEGTEGEAGRESIDVRVFAFW